MLPLSGGTERRADMVPPFVLRPGDLAEHILRSAHALLIPGSYQFPWHGRMDAARDLYEEDWNAPLYRYVPTDEESTGLVQGTSCPET